MRKCSLREVWYKSYVLFKKIGTASDAASFKNDDDEETGASGFVVMVAFFSFSDEDVGTEMG
jgi:hypothetical protein